MELRQIFFNTSGRLRSGWRLLIFIVVYIFLSLVVASAVRLGYAIASRGTPGLSPGGLFDDLIFRFVLLVCSLGAGYICARLLEGLPWRSLGVNLHEGWFRDLLIGSAIGIASLALATGIATAGGGLRFSVSTAGTSQVSQTLIVSFGLFIVAALAEEALFRGYPLQTLTRAQLAWLGALLTSVPFAAVHLKNPNGGSILAFINTALAGIWLALAYLRTRSLWLPLGVHWAWNWALGSLFGLPVSGMTKIAPHPLFQGTDLGPAWFTGGSYGIEGGVACTVALVVSTIFIWRTNLVSATPEMLRLTGKENPVANGVGPAESAAEPVGS